MRKGYVTNGNGLTLYWIEGRDGPGYYARIQVQQDGTLKVVPLHAQKEEDE